MDITQVATWFGAALSLIMIFKYGVLSPLTGLIEKNVSPLKTLIKELTSSIDRLEKTSRDEHASIHKRLDLEDKRIDLCEKNIIRHEEQLKALSDDSGEKEEA